MPMNRSLYPSNWDEIALKIKSEANWTCESCGRPCRRPGEPANDAAWRIEVTNHWTTHELYEETTDAQGYPITDCKLGRFTLTVAHLDHRPENCDRSNLRALCAPCHCRYDLSQMSTKQRLNRERKGQLSLSFVPDMEPDSIATPSGTTKVTPTETTTNSVRDTSDRPKSTPKSTPKSSARKRFPKRGKASGWLETRTANPKRKKPNQYQVYRWESEGKRHTRSVRKAIAHIIEEMINNGAPWSAIVEKIEQSRNHSKLI